MLIQAAIDWAEWELEQVFKEERAKNGLQVLPPVDRMGFS